MYSGKQWCGQNTLPNFYSEKWYLTGAWLMAFPLPKIKRTEKDQILSSFFCTDVHSQPATMHSGGSAVSHCVGQCKPWLTSSARWGRHAQNRIRSDRILTFFFLSIYHALCIILKLCLTGSCSFNLRSHVNINCKCPDMSSSTILYTCMEGTGLSAVGDRFLARCSRYVWRNNSISNRNSKFWTDNKIPIEVLGGTKYQH